MSCEWFDKTHSVGFLILHKPPRLSQCHWNSAAARFMSIQWSNDNNGLSNLPAIQVATLAACSRGVFHVWPGCFPCTVVHPRVLHQLRPSGSHSWVASLLVTLAISKWKNRRTMDNCWSIEIRPEKRDKLITLPAEVATYWEPRRWSFWTDPSNGCEGKRKLSCDWKHMLCRAYVPLCSK